MLSKEHNELITRTGAGTPMGDLIRRYWIPALLSEEIPAPDCPPVQVRIMGEELVAFRDSQGRIGLLEDHCSHRGTSLSYGRNENCGLRCIYHGWQYDVEGRVLETPAEPASSTFKDRIRHPAHPTREAGGMIFAYIGPHDPSTGSGVPLFPDFSWNNVPANQTYVTKAVLECNYLQGLEGECDSAHLSFLHRDFSRDGRQALYATDSAPEYETEDTDFGVRLIATRRAGPDRNYVRVSSFVMPVSCWVPARNKEVHFYVPIDDTRSWRFDFGFLEDRLPNDADRGRLLQIGPDYTRIRTQRNRYLQDREVQREETFTGITDFLNHDACATETMGPIYDRSREHLGSSDKGVIAVRRRLIEAAQALLAGQDPPHVLTNPEKNRFPHVDTFGEVIAADTPWREAFPHLTLETPGGELAASQPAVRTVVRT